jgi:hypothetical protein
VSKIHTAAAPIPAKRSPAVRLPRWRLDPYQVTVPWPVSVSCYTPDRASSGHIFSKFSLATHPRLCIKIVDQCSSYNVAITTTAKFLLNHA